MKKLIFVIALLISVAAMATALKNAKTVGVPFGNAEEWVTVEYDFSKDGGTIADYDVITADGDLIITDMFAYGQTTQTGTPVFDLGVGAGGTEFWSDKAASGLADGSLATIDTVGFVKVADGSKIVLGIETNAAVDGKFKMQFKVKAAE